MDTPAQQEGTASNEKGVGPLAPERCEGGIDLAVGVGVDDLDLQSHGAGGRFHVSQHGLGSCSIGWIGEHSNPSQPRNEFTKEPQPLCRQLFTEKIDAGRVAARPGEAGNKPNLDRVTADTENDRDRRCCSFGRD